MSEDASSAPVTAGLSEGEAQARLKREGYNELPRAGRRTPFRIIVEVMREPMLALLAGGGAVYLALGDLQGALILLAFAMFTIIITVVQETRTEHVLEALRDLTSPRALVIRDGVRKRIAAVKGYREFAAQNRPEGWNLRGARFVALIGPALPTSNWRASAPRLLRPASSDSRAPSPELDRC